MTESAGTRLNRRFQRIARWRGPRSARDRLLVALLALAIMIAMVFPMFSNPIDFAAPPARDGVLDLTGFQGNGDPVQAVGTWRLVWLGPALRPTAQPVVPIQVPGLWTGHRLADGQVLPEAGHVRYELVLRGLAPGRYVMQLPVIWAGSRATLDGHELSRRGMIGDGPATTRYYLRAQQFAFDATGRDIVLGIEEAAFLHRENGMEEAPVFGSPDAMDRWLALKWSREHLYNISLLLIAGMGIAVFLFRPQDRASLYFGLSCLTFLPTAAILGFDNIFQIMFPALAFAPSLAIQYLTGVVAVTFFFLNAHELFPRESSPVVARAILSGFAAIFAIHAFLFLRGDTIAASHFQQKVFMLLALFTLIYMVAILIRAVWNRRDGALIFLLGMGLFVFSFFVSTTVMSGWLSRDRVAGYEFTAMGMVMLLYSHVVLMAERWSLSVGRAEETNDDLRQLLEVNTAITSDLQLGSLLAKIVAVTSSIIRADRSTLFLKDAQSPALDALVAQGIEGGKLRVDVGRGLAGYVYATGETVNISDAYNDERFNRSVDEETGYRTRSVLTVPITARDGRRIGVMQALNREQGQSFTADDAARMGAFGAQAAVAIDNARLFSEAVSAKSFDESILRSMSGGVIALDLAWKITKLNAAAAEILGASATLLTGLDARTVLPRFNPRLVDEIAAVADRGDPKLLLDIELATASERPSSVNLSITPLEGDSGRVGVLLVFEDISEGKRLQGAMRRFMTQEVVDQVLGRDDDSLFGTACQASVLFADIRGFTTMAEELSARETVETLNELFTELYEAVSGNGGVLDKYIGDAVMAVFGAPLSSDRDPDNAFASGLEMLRMLDTINARRSERGAAPLRLGVGIATGEVVAGTIGSPKRMDYTVIGDSVNLAARLQDLTKAYGVEMLIDETTARAVTTTQPLREIDLIAVRGRKRPEAVFEVLARDDADAAGHAAFALGRAALAERRWDDALAAFGSAVGRNPDDRPAQIMLARAQALAHAPPADDWDGVWRDGLVAAA
jgi:adenylate cyclase